MISTDNFHDYCQIPRLLRVISTITTDISHDYNQLFPRFLSTIPPLLPIISMIIFMIVIFIISQQKAKLTYIRVIPQLFPTTKIISMIISIIISTMNPWIFIIISMIIQLLLHYYLFGDTALQ